MKEGESLILYPGEIRNLNDVMMWHFNDIPITEISEDLSFVCTHAPCTYVDERFRDRLQLDNQTGSLTITNITNQHAGHYHLKISSSRFSIKRTFSVTVNGEYYLIIQTNVIYMKSVLMFPVLRCGFNFQTHQMAPCISRFNIIRCKYQSKLSVALQ